MKENHGEREPFSPTGLPTGKYNYLLLTE